MPISHNNQVEWVQCLYLGNLLLTIARNLFNMTIVATWSFTKATNKFVEIIDTPHVRLSEHVARFTSYPGRATMVSVLLKGLIETGMTKRSFEDLYDIFRDDLSRAPGMDEGRLRIKLPPLGNTTTVHTFRQLVQYASRVRMERLEGNRQLRARKTREKKPGLRPYVDTFKERVEIAESTDPNDHDYDVLHQRVNEARAVLKAAEKSGKSVAKVDAAREGYNTIRRQWRRLARTEPEKEDASLVRFREERQHLAALDPKDVEDEEDLHEKVKEAQRLNHVAKKGTEAERRAAMDNLNEARRNLNRVVALKKKVARSTTGPENETSKKDDLSEDFGTGLDAKTPFMADDDEMTISYG